MILQHFQTPSVQQLLTTAARLGANPAGSAFEAIATVGFNNWIEAADQEHHLTLHCVESYADSVLRHKAGEHKCHAIGWSCRMKLGAQVI